MRHLLVVSGEASSDQYAGDVVRRLKELRPDLRVSAVGSARVAAAGAEMIADAADLAIVGITEAVAGLRGVLRVFHRVKRYAVEERVDAALLLDLPDFNLRLAKFLKRRGIAVAYYVSPQVWAWRGKRVEVIRKVVDRLFVVLPFEETYFRDRGIVAEYVGHPLVERVPERVRDAVLPAPGHGTIAIVPGSRRSELAHHRRVLREVVSRLRGARPAAKFLLPLAPTLDREAVARAFEGLPVEIVECPLPEVVGACDVAIVASGTATLETALAGTPLLMFYRLSWPTALLFGGLSGYRGHYSLPNLVLDKPVIREFLQHRASAARICAEAERLLDDAAYRAEQLGALRALRTRLRGSGCAERVARGLLVATGGRRPVSESVPDGAPYPAH